LARIKDKQSQIRNSNVILYLISFYFPSNSNSASLPCGNPIKWLLDFSVVQPGGAIVSIAIRLIDAPTDELSAKITFAFINSLGADATKFGMNMETNFI
jgi:hypothetical protein